MCTSLVINKKKTLIGWNLDLKDMEYRVRPEKDGVFIDILDAKEGWMPIFGANSRGDFVGMPACWPFDKRSDPEGGERNVILLDMDLLYRRKTLGEIKDIAEKEKISSVPGVTFMAALSDGEGNALHIIPGQGVLYYPKPEYKILTNFSPFKQDSEKHPWMGWDRYTEADRRLKKAPDDIDADGCFEILRAVAQEVCPTVVSMVYDVKEKIVYWYENKNGILSGEQNEKRTHRFAD
ncbi:MAG: hypothetical protein IJV00_04450 [Clostridia bacterium]|nr:hypothetical protein [Clostridia bacterium]